MSTNRNCIQCGDPHGGARLEWGSYLLMCDKCYKQHIQNFIIACQHQVYDEGL